MAEKRDCSFCASAVEPGTGMMYIKRDGTRYHFCSSKCRRNLLDLKRVPRTIKWTKHYVKGLGKASAIQSKKMPVAKRVATAAATTGGSAASVSAPVPKAVKPAKPKGEGASPKSGPKAK